MAKDCIELSDKGHELLNELQRSYSKTNQMMEAVFPSAEPRIPESEEFVLEMCIRVTVVLMSAVSVSGRPVFPPHITAAALMMLHDEGMLK